MVQADARFQAGLARNAHWRSNMYSPGSEEEVAFRFTYLNGVLKKQGRALSWLLAQLAADGSQPARSADVWERMRIVGSVQ